MSQNSIDVPDDVATLVSDDEHPMHPAKKHKADVCKLFGTCTKKLLQQHYHGLRCVVNCFIRNVTRCHYDRGNSTKCTCAKSSTKSANKPSSPSLQVHPVSPSTQASSSSSCSAALCFKKSSDDEIPARLHLRRMIYEANGQGDFAMLSSKVEDAIIKMLDGEPSLCGCGLATTRLEQEKKREYSTNSIGDAAEQLKLAKNSFENDNEEANVPEKIVNACSDASTPSSSTPHVHSEKPFLVVAFEGLVLTSPTGNVGVQPTCEDCVGREKNTSNANAMMLQTVTNATFAANNTHINNTSLSAASSTGQGQYESPLGLTKLLVGFEERNETASQENTRENSEKQGYRECEQREKRNAENEASRCDNERDGGDHNVPSHPATGINNTNITNNTNTCSPPAVNDFPKHHQHHQPFRDHDDGRPLKATRQKIVHVAHQQESPKLVLLDGGDRMLQERDSLTAFVAATDTVGACSCKCKVASPQNNNNGNNHYHRVQTKVKMVESYGVLDHDKGNSSLSALCDTARGVCTCVQHQQPAINLGKRPPAQKKSADSSSFSAFSSRTLHSIEAFGGHSLPQHPVISSPNHNNNNNNPPRAPPQLYSFAAAPTGFNKNSNILNVENNNNSLSLSFSSFAKTSAVLRCRKLSPAQLPKVKELEYKLLNRFLLSRTPDHDVCNYGDGNHNGINNSGNELQIFEEEPAKSWSCKKKPNTATQKNGGLPKNKNTTATDKSTASTSIHSLEAETRNEMEKHTAAVAMTPTPIAIPNFTKTTKESSSNCEKDNNHEGGLNGKNKNTENRCSVAAAEKRRLGNSAIKTNSLLVTNNAKQEQRPLVTITTQSMGAHYYGQANNEKRQQASLAPLQNTNTDSFYVSIPTVYSILPRPTTSTSTPTPTNASQLPLRSCALLNHPPPSHTDPDPALYSLSPSTKFKNDKHPNCVTPSSHSTITTYGLQSCAAATLDTTNACTRKLSESAAHVVSARSGTKKGSQVTSMSHGKLSPTCPQSSDCMQFVLNKNDKTKTNCAHKTKDDIDAKDAASSDDTNYIKEKLQRKQGKGSFQRKIKTVDEQKQQTAANLLRDGKNVEDEVKTHLINSNGLFTSQLNSNRIFLPQPFSAMNEDRAKLIKNHSDNDVVNVCSSNSSTSYYYYHDEERLEVTGTSDVHVLHECTKARESACAPTVPFFVVDSPPISNNPSFAYSSSSSVHPPSFGSGEAIKEMKTAHAHESLSPARNQWPSPSDVTTRSNSSAQETVYGSDLETSRRRSMCSGTSYYYYYYYDNNGNSYSHPDDDPLITIEGTPTTAAVDERMHRQNQPPTLLSSRQQQTVYEY